MCALAVLVLTTPAVSQDVQTQDVQTQDVQALAGRVADYGLFEPLERPQNQPASACAPPPFVLKERTAHVPLELLTRFGVFFVLDCQDQTAAGASCAEGETVQLRANITHPYLRDAVTGKGSTAHGWQMEACLETLSYVGWEFSAGWELQAGTWAIELYHGRELLLSHSFEAVVPERRGNVALRYSLAAEKQTDHSDNATAAPVADNATESLAAEETGAAYAVQAASCLRKENAAIVAEDLRQAGYAPRIAETGSAGEHWYVVRFGTFATLEEALQAGREYRERFGVAPVVIHLRESRKLKE